MIIVQKWIMTFDKINRDCFLENLSKTKHWSPSRYVITYFKQG